MTKPDVPRPGALERGDGSVEIVFRRTERGSRLAHLFQQAPCRVLFPRPAQGEPPLAMLVTISGGLAGGDRLRLDVAVEAGAAAVVTSAAAEKVYRSLGPDCRIRTRLVVGEGGWLEWLPQPTILFGGARLDRRTVVELAPGARLLAGEAVIFGRAARGEHFAVGRLFDGWRLSLAGRLAWADALDLDPATGALAGPAGFGGAGALATLIYAGPDAAGLLDAARALLAPAGARAGVTRVNGMLLARFLAEDASALGEDLRRYAGGLRERAAGLPARLSRLWQG